MRGFPPLRGLAPLVVFGIAWQLFGSDDSTFFPRPSSWFLAARDMWSAGDLGPAVAVSLETLALSLATATIIGAVLGYVIGSSRIADRTLGPMLEFLRAMPSGAIVPVGLLLLGFGLRMIVIVVVFAAIWPIMLGTREAVRGFNPILIDAARTLHLSRSDRIRKVVLPSLLPSILVGVSVATPISIVVTLLAEFLVQVGGVGALLFKAQTNFLSKEVYALTVVAGLFGLLLNGLVGLLTERVSRLCLPA